MYDEEITEPEFLKRPKTNPFRTPDHYFDSIEDRIISGIQNETKKKTSSTKVFRLLKPVLSLAASFALIFMLVYKPVNRFLSPQGMVKSETIDTNASSSQDLMDVYSLNVSTIDENSLVNAIFSDEKATALAEINPDEVLAYLTSDMNDLEIYSEIQN